MNNEQMVVSLRKPKEAAAPSPPPQNPVPPKPRPRPQEKGFSIAPVVGFLLLAALAFGFWYVFLRDSAPQSGSADLTTQEAMPAEAVDVIAAVGKLIVLPEGEEPTVATVTDPEKLKDQAFFANAKPGHKVLIYTQARKAYLYDPAENRLIEVAPITTDIQ